MMVFPAQVPLGSLQGGHCFSAEVPAEYVLSVRLLRITLQGCPPRKDVSQGSTEKQNQHSCGERGLL